MKFLFLKEQTRKIQGSISPKKNQHERKKSTKQQKKRASK